MASDAGEGRRRPRLPRLGLAPFKREIPLSGMLSDTLSNVLASLLVIAIGGALVSNSTFQLSLFTRVRNAFVGEMGRYERIADINCIALDDETSLLQDELDLPGKSYDAIAAAIESANAYAKSAPERRVVIGVDFVLNGAGREKGPKRAPKELERLELALSSLEDNAYAVLGAALSQAGTETAYFRFDVYRDALLDGIRREKGEAYVARHIFVGNIHILEANAVSGFQTLEDTKIALGYLPIYEPAAAAPYYYSLPLMMYMLGEVLPAGDIGEGAFSCGPNGDLRADYDVDAALRGASGREISFFRNASLRYNFFSPDDISYDSPGKLNYFPLGRLAKEFDTSGYPVRSLAEAFGQRRMQLSLRGISVREGKADYFLVFRAKSLGYIGEGASSDVVATPASGRDPFTDSIQTVSGAMTHVAALSNLLHHEYLREAPAWLGLGLTLALALLALWIGLYREFRTIMLAGLAITIGVIAFGFVLFLCNVFFAVRLPLVVPLGIALVLGAGRFLKGMGRD